MTAPLQEHVVLKKEFYIMYDKNFDIWIKNIDIYRL